MVVLHIQLVIIIVVLERLRHEGGDGIGMVDQPRKKAFQQRYQNEKAEDERSRSFSPAKNLYTQEIKKKEKYGQQLDGCYNGGNKKSTFKIGFFNKPLYHFQEKKQYDQPD
jgi:hypothetical protein